VGLLLSSGLSNYQVGESSFWKNQILPNNSIPNEDKVFAEQKLYPHLHLLLSLPASSIPTMEKEALRCITSKKIRIYPENEPLWLARRIFIVGLTT
jgi:hypothetical protein